MSSAAYAPAVHEPLSKAGEFVVFEVDSSGGLAKNEVVVRFSAALFERGTMTSVSSTLWRLPPARRIHRRATAKHGISTRDVENNGYAALDQLDIVDALLHDFKRRNVAVVSHDAKLTTRLLQQTAAAHMADWKLPCRIVCLKTASRPILNIRGKSPRAPRPPTPAELYRYLHKRLPPGVSSLKIAAANFAAARARGWV